MEKAKSPEDSSHNRYLKINGDVGYGKPVASDTVIKYEKAVEQLVELERGTGKYGPKTAGEIEAIVSHWLQNPGEPPIIVDANRTKTWLKTLGTMDKSAAVYIDYGDLPDKFRPVMAENGGLKFIDLFAGIGGFRIALQDAGCKCVFTSEWDRYAKANYFSNYGEYPFGDITEFTESGGNGAFGPDNIPDHDILCGGFPCQPFSQAGKGLGFEDTRGTLFFDILEIAKAKRPRVLFLENVKRLKGHDNKRTFRIILNNLHEIGYKVYADQICAYDYGVPQNRERIFIVAFSEAIDFKFPNTRKHAIYRNVGDILEKNPSAGFTITDAMWKGHVRRRRNHRDRGNGFGYSLFNGSDEYINTLSARYWKDGSEALISQKDKNPRTLTPRECARAQGFPEHFTPHPSDKQAYKQFGNSVAVPAVAAITEEIIRSLNQKSPVNSLDPYGPLVGWWKDDECRKIRGKNRTEAP